MSLVEDEAKLEQQMRLVPADSADYLSLLKPRVMSLVVFTAAVGLMLAPGHINPILGFIAIFCIAVGGGASGALNMWYDADIDALMKRTRNRAIPARKITREQVFIFATFLACASVIFMGVFINWFAAIFLAFTIFFYVVIYTMWLKRSTPQNIVIGGASGAFPPMIGWAAVTGSVSLESLILFMIIFLWTPPHFWALSLFTTTDYGAAQVPMMPNIRGEASTKNQIFVYSLLMVAAGIAPYFLALGGLIYLMISSLLGLIFMWYAYKLWRATTGDSTIYYAKKLFFFSLSYLSALFGLLLVENLFWRFVAFWGAN